MRKLLHFQSLLTQHALRAAPKPRPHSQSHHHRLLPSPNRSAPAPASPSPWSHLLWRRDFGTATAAASFLPRGTAAAFAAAARTAASQWLSAARRAGSLDLFSLQRWRGSGWQFSESTFLHGAALMLIWMDSAEGVVWMLIGANAAVFMLWRVADPEFMKRHFMLSLDNFKSGRLHTLLTSAFSHVNPVNLLSNMLGLYFFGRTIATTFGPPFLLKLYVAGALTGSAFFLLHKAFLAPRKQDYVGPDNSRAPFPGARAAIDATMLLYFFLYPKSQVYLFFTIPIPAAIVGVAFIGADLLRVNKGGDHVSSSGYAHLGGALVAAFVSARIRKGRI